MTNPSDVYAARLADRTQVERSLGAMDGRISQARLAAFAALAGLAAAAWQGLVTWWWLLLPLGGFIGLVRWHDRVIRRREFTARAVLYYDRGLARIGDRWAGTGQTGERFSDPSHPYAADLDLFGRGSLFELLSVARTRMGEETLAAWLMRPTSAEDVLARQEAVTELTPLIDLRERMAVAGEAADAGVDAAALESWAEQSPPTLASWLRPAALVLTGAALAGIVRWMATGRPALLIAGVLLQFAVFTLVRPRLHALLHRAAGWSRNLDLLASALDTIADASFASARLSELKTRMELAGTRPGAAIRRLHRLVELHDWQHNMIFAVIAIPLLWDVHVALAMESWRRRYGPKVRIWLDAVGEFEALSSLATYRFEHPHDPFPTLAEAGSGAKFEGNGLGHPLLSAERMVANDVHLSGERIALLIVSGSNMSGKSTLLRTIGVNAVLAFAGAPVRARALTLTPLALGATLRIQDSLQEGRSRFYAEITRIRELATIAAGRPPLLFLLDELFHGTNSHDRVTGAAGVLRSLLERGAIGLVTTHDLALAGIAAQLAPHAANVHFEDRFEGGELLFDYRMRPGPVARSNALALMRAVGLEVGEEP